MDGYVIFVKDSEDIFWASTVYFRSEYPNKGIEDFQRMVLEILDREKKSGNSAYLSKIEPLTDEEIESSRNFLGMS